jgi:hypothetical protein
MHAPFAALVQSNVRKTRKICICLNSQQTVVALRRSSCEVPSFLARANDLANYCSRSGNYLIQWHDLRCRQASWQLLPAWAVPRPR